MKRFYVIVVLFLFFISVPNFAFAGGHRVISGPELQVMMEDQFEVVIVDVREPERYNQAHIPGAINIPYDGAHKRVVKELPRGKRIVFVCHGGPMGDELAGVLLRNDFKDIYNLRGGMRKWRGPLERHGK